MKKILIFLIIFMTISLLSNNIFVYEKSIDDYIQIINELSNQYNSSAYKSYSCQSYDEYIKTLLSTNIYDFKNEYLNLFDITLNNLIDHLSQG